MDYKKFAADLRAAAGSYEFFYGAPRRDLEKAADVIEELAAKLELSRTPLVQEELQSMDCLTKDLRALYEKAKGYQQNQAPSPDYSTGRTDGFYAGVRYVFDKIEEQSNEPLTPEELREMDGEPVWVASPDHVFEPCWMLVMLRHDFVMANWQICDFKEYGKTWLAYRRRPEEGTAWQQ